MAAAVAFIAYRGRPLESRELFTLMQDEFSRLAAAGGTFALRHVSSVNLAQLLPNQAVDPGEIHFLELSLAGNATLATGPTPADAGLPEGEGLGPALWTDVLALHVSRAAGAALTLLLDKDQQVGYFALFLRGERIRSTWLAAGRRRVEIVEGKVEAAKPAPEAQGGEPFAAVPISGFELIAGGDGLRAQTKNPAAFTEQLYAAAFETGRPSSRWVIARGGRMLDTPEAFPEEQAKSLRPVF
jgi:hypothetical protein